MILLVCIIENSFIQRKPINNSLNKRTRSLTECGRALYKPIVHRASYYLFLTYCYHVNDIFPIKVILLLNKTYH